MKEKVIYLIKGEDRMGREIMAGACEALEAANPPATVWAHQHIRGDVLNSGDVSAVVGILSEDHVRERALRKPGIPLLNLSNRCGPLPGAGNLLSDDREIGRLAARFLIGKGYVRFLILTRLDLTVHRERAEGFEEVILEAGHPLDTVDRALFRSKGPSAGKKPATRDHHDFFRPHLRNLPLGSGIFSTSDQLAFRFLHCMRDEFPEHMDTSGVLGVDNDFGERWG